MKLQTESRNLPRKRETIVTVIVVVFVWGEHSQGVTSLGDQLCVKHFQTYANSSSMLKMLPEKQGKVDKKNTKTTKLIPIKLITVSE